MSDFHKAVSEGLYERQAKNPHFSMRSYARYLGINPTSLSLFLNGKRDLAPVTKRKIATRLQMSSPLLAEALKQKGKNFDALSADRLQCLSDWYYFAILSLMETPSFRDDPEWIADRLNISASAASEALDRLENAGLISGELGKRTASGKQFTTSDQVASLAVQRSHFQALDLARTSLENHNVDQRNFSAMTMAIDPERLPEAARRIRQFRRRLAEYLEGGNKKEVYRLSLQLFPLTRLDHE